MPKKSSVAAARVKDIYAESESLMKILYGLPDAVLMIDGGGEVFYTNPAAERLFGVNAGESSSFPLNRILPESSPYRVAENLAELWRTVEEVGHLEDFETQMLDKNNKIIDTIAVKTAIRDRRGKLLGISTVIRDITDSKESEQRISRRNRQLFALIDVAEAITQTAEVETLLERILNAVLRVMSLDSGCVHLLNEENETLELSVMQNLSARVAEMLEHFELGEGLVGQTAVLAETLLVSDTAFDRRLARPVSNEKIRSLVAVPLVGRGGIVRGVLTLFHDQPRNFTEHEKSMLTGIGKQVGVALERQNLLNEVTVARTEWEETFDAMTDGVSIHAPSGRIKRANKSLAQIFSRENETTLVGIRCCELYHNSKKPRPDCTIMRTVTERLPQKVEIDDATRGRVLRIITDPIISGGRVAGVVCTTRDVTDEKMIERRLIQQERISAVGEISAGIAHEIGTPLNIISANVEFLIRSNQNLQDCEEIQAIREQTSNITQLIKQLLNFSRERSPEFAPVNINQLIEKTVSLLNHRLQAANIETQLNLAPYMPTVDGDTSQIQQILFNLIQNAQQAMEIGANDERRLKIATDTAFLPNDDFSQPHIVITITDTGGGIRESDLPQIFTPFFTANKEGGTGLGLAISHRIIQRHLGLLSIKNNSQKGVIATIRLPLSQT